MANSINQNGIQIEVRRERQCKATPPFKLARMIHLLLRVAEVPQGAYVYTAEGPTESTYAGKALWGEITPIPLEPHYGRLVLKHGELARESFAGVLHLSKSVGPNTRELWVRLQAAVTTLGEASWIEGNLNKRLRPEVEEPTQAPVPSPKPVLANVVELRKKAPPTKPHVPLLMNASNSFRFAVQWAALRKEFLLVAKVTSEAIAEYTVSLEASIRAQRLRIDNDLVSDTVEFGRAERVAEETRKLIVHLQAELSTMEREIHSINAHIQSLQRGFSKAEELEFMKCG